VITDSIITNCIAVVRPTPLYNYIHKYTQKIMALNGYKIDENNYMAYLLVRWNLVLKSNETNSYYKHHCRWHHSAMQTSGAVVQSHVLLLVLHNTTSFTNIALKKDDLCSGCNTSRMYRVYTWNKVRQNHAFILWHFVIITHSFVLLIKQGGLFVLRNESFI